MGFLHALGSSPQQQGIVSRHFRNARFARFRQFVAGYKRPLRILDLGGTELYWNRMGVTVEDGFAVTMVNLKQVPVSTPGFVSIAGNVCDLSSIDPTQFDVVHSNSVIEHLFTLDNQRQMACEVQKLGLPFWIQTPNYWFPIEPHFHWLGWQWYPRALRIFMMRRYRCGMRAAISDRTVAARRVDEVRLMTARELRACFPTAVLMREHFGPLTKSFIVHHGFRARVQRAA